MKTGKTATGLLVAALVGVAAMEPGHEDREDAVTSPLPGMSMVVPQWSPVMKTGKTGRTAGSTWGPLTPQWSPVMKTGKTFAFYAPKAEIYRPQWSPVMKTGKTVTHPFNGW